MRQHSHPENYNVDCDAGVVPPCVVPAVLIADSNVIVSSEFGYSIHVVKGLNKFLAIHA